MFLQILCVLFLLPAALVCLYYVSLALFVLISREESASIEGTPANTFAIVIPAHNEEKNISTALRSCIALDYPRDKYRIFVIADNCSDRTAEIANNNGATCLERYDEEKKGKGFALEWGFKQILAEKHDALVVLDADCQLDNHALRIFDYYLKKGEKVLQANDAASNPDNNAMSYAVAVGNLIENRLFYAPKSRLGLAVLLRGTGMVFRREVLEQHPWKAHSAVEDAEYTLRLIKSGIKVRFINEVNVFSEFPDQKNQLQVQRMRWAKNLGFSKMWAFRLIREGMIQGRGLLIDAGWTLLVLSRPLVLLELFIAVILGLFCAWLLPGPLSKGLFAVGLILLLIQFVYFGLGVALLGMNSRRIVLLLSSPATIGRLILISLLGVFGVRGNIWARTPR
jgi:cellulose synthase/poly-beta-1,6-N-acetylglucosamine synthase-like glycosyltransferase